LELSLEPILVGADKASPIALILNELLTNALKHAFPDGRGGRLSLTVRREGADLVAEIEDDGRGLATSAPVGGFGSTLVQTLTRQLRGRLDWPAIPQGTRARLRLPAASDLDPGV
ncbi:sensor histidine kinase, partial [Bradyrhizobium sp. NBAIM08]|uniref:sensor histidine kinase n=1 Tax=Bradyrhizobium sp. NBAIM08 TaxID=2793815 RepID=UPI001CD2BD6B